MIERRFVPYSEGLVIPDSQRNERESGSRLLFHFSPKSKTDERNGGDLIPQGPIFPRSIVSLYDETKDGPFRPDAIAGDYRPYATPYVKQWVEALPDWVWEPHSFFFLDSPFPQQWQDSQPWYFEFCMAYVRKGNNEPLNVFALETTAADEVYVVDREPMARDMWNAYADDIIDYANSRVPLAEYRGDYLLPEVITPHVIAAERLIHCGEVIIPDVPIESRPKPPVIQINLARCF